MLAVFTVIFPKKKQQKNGSLLKGGNTFTRDPLVEELPFDGPSVSMRDAAWPSAQGIDARYPSFPYGNILVQSFFDRPAGAGINNGELFSNLLRQQVRHRLGHRSTHSYHRFFVFQV